jgi:hypothetical protein
LFYDLPDLNYAGHGRTMNAAKIRVRSRATEYKSEQSSRLKGAAIEKRSRTGGVAAGDRVIIVSRMTPDDHAAYNDLNHRRIEEIITHQDCIGRWWSGNLIRSSARQQ